MVVRGVDFLLDLYRALERNTTPRPVTASTHLAETPPSAAVHLAEGSWGANGDFSKWLNPDTEWTWLRLWPAEDRFWSVAARAIERSDAHPVLEQAARELLLAQSSDWQFIISSATAGDYASKRFTEHLDNLDQLLGCSRPLCYLSRPSRLPERCGPGATSFLQSSLLSGPPWPSEDPDRMTTGTGRRSVVIHGHFYQPPREDPWIDLVEREISAAPFHDWNQRVDHECYRAVLAARVVGEDGSIRRIVNTLEWISFNVGPTLLEWMEKEAPATYRGILAADRASMIRLGAGNAIAMPYHHTILPLASYHDKVTEVRWGIADFRRRFGREPVGMWLPETAVDDETLDVLAMEDSLHSPGAASVDQAPAGWFARTLPDRPRPIDRDHPL